VHFKRTRYTGAHRGRHADETTSATNTTGTTAGANTTATAATTEGATGSATKATAAGTTTAVANTPAVEKPGKKEKIRFGQAPREALPPAAHPTGGSEQAAGQAAGAEAGAGNEAQVASNSSSGDVPSGEAAAAVDRKTRFADRARQPKAKKVKTPDQTENERVAQPDTPEEAAAQKTQSAPLGLAGDTATKKKAPKVKGEKTRYSDEVNKSKEPAPPPQQTSTPSPLATPGTVPTSSDNAPADTGAAPAQPNDTTPAQPNATTPAPAQPQP
jgi:peptidyl-prolyl cis-trans isomerase SurA